MKLLLLDKDGTIARSTRGEFINRPWHQEPIPGAMEAIDYYIGDGWTAIVISNQGGVEAGHKSLESAIHEMQFCMELFPIECCYFCPDFAGAECWKVWHDCSNEKRIHIEENDFVVQELDIKNQFRKPNAGMLKLAIADYAEATEILYVGDMTRSNSPKGEDENAAIAAGIRFLNAEEWRNGNH